MMKSRVDEGKIRAIQELVAHMFGLRTEELCRIQPDRTTTIPRQLAMYLARHETDASLAEIGSLFGGKHHTTVIYAVEKIEALRHADAATNLAIDIIRMNLRSAAVI